MRTPFWGGDPQRADKFMDPKEIAVTELVINRP